MAWKRKALAVPSLVLCAPRSSADSMSCQSPDLRVSDMTAIVITPVMSESSS